MLKSPLSQGKAESVSVCGKILRKGQSILVHESAIGPRERAKVAKGDISIRSSNEKGKVQVTCTLSA